MTQLMTSQIIVTSGLHVIIVKNFWMVDMEPLVEWLFHPAGTCLW